MPPTSHSRVPASVRIGVVTALAAAGAGACGGADGLGPRDLAGVYVLQRVNGQALPATLFDGTRYGGAVYADTLSLRPDGTIDQVLYLGHTQGAPTSTPHATGTWRVSGSAVTLTYQAAPATAPTTKTTYSAAVGLARDLSFAESAVGRDAVYGRL